MQPKQLDGLRNITSVCGDLQINDNPALTNLYGLIKLTSLGGTLKIQDNIVLPTSLAYGLRDKLVANVFTGEVYISGNLEK